MINEQIKNSYINSFTTSNQFLKDIILINTKCLVDDKKNGLVKIDYTRLQDEISFYKYCCIENKNIKNCLNIIIPISLSNVNLERSTREVENLIEFYFRKSQDFHEVLLCAVSYNNLIHNLIKNKLTNLKDIVSNIKEQIIQYSFKNFKDKIDIIKFEKCRIDIIQKLDKLDDGAIEFAKTNSVIDEFFKCIHHVYVCESKEQTEEFRSIKNAIYGILNFDIGETVKNKEFIVSMANYICKLRTYEINKKNYSLRFDARQLINLNIGDVYDTPILSKIKVEDKKIDSNILHMKISSKSGIYNIQFKRN